MTIVAATGNDGVSEISYPASSKYTLSVGATNNLDLVSDYSNYGKVSIWWRREPIFQASFRTGMSLI
ncbi:S8 family serine peptidase [Bacillus licheniformis]|nr:S8 family serine peptidase [Bacillus licheniformis]